MKPVKAFSQIVASRLAARLRKLNRTAILKVSRTLVEEYGPRSLM